MDSKKFLIVMMLATPAGYGCMRERPLASSPSSPNALLGSPGINGQEPTGEAAMAAPNANGSQVAPTSPPPAGAPGAPPPERSWFASFYDWLRVAHGLQPVRNDSSDDDRPHAVYAD
jgi:hypothetical protein